MRKLFLSLVILLFTGFSVTSCSSNDVISGENPELINVKSDKKEQVREAGQKLLESLGTLQEKNLIFRQIESV